MRQVLIVVAFLVSACTQIPTEQPPTLSVSAEARCAEFTRIASDMTTTAYRRATAGEQLRAQRCPGYQ